MADRGAGITAIIASQKVTISNSTIANNVAAVDFGGGIASDVVTADAGTGLFVINSTIVGNSAPVGGGIFSFDTGGAVLRLGSSIVSGNTADDGEDLGGEAISLGFNAIGTTSGATLAGDTSTDLLDSAAQLLSLGTLADNGGPTLTMALGDGSVAIEHGNCTTLSSVQPNITDQRGLNRKNPCDIGAYETVPDLPIIIGQPASQTIQSGETAALSVLATGLPPLSYQWYQGDVLDSSTPVGTNSPSFTTPPLTEDTRYWVRVSNANGSIDSDVALIAIHHQFVVDSTSDALLAACTDAPDDCSLRGAIDNANQHWGINTISFDPVVFADPQTIALASSFAPITYDLVITGPGTALLALDGAHAFTPFTVASGVTVSLSGMTITGASGTLGGAIHNDGTLTLIDLTIATSTATNGGGIYNTGILNVSDTSISGSAAINGGGIDNHQGSAFLTNVTISGNTADQASGYGGGISNGGDLTVISSAVVLNSAARGGGIDTTAGSVIVSNSTVANNTATDDGAGVYGTSGAAITLTNSTVAYNSATGATSSGGGIANSGDLTLGSVLIASNSAAQAPDLSGSADSLGYNLITDTSGAIFTGDTDTNVVDAAVFPLNLGTLGDHGGTTPTVDLTLGSIAISHGNCSTLPGIAVLTTDQIGTSRKPYCDVGAYETAPSAPVVDIPPQSQTINSGQTASLSVVATGAGPISYQWYRGTAPDTSDPIVGGTSPDFTTPVLTATASYWVRVSNSIGAVNSATAIVTVQPVCATFPYTVPAGDVTALINAIACANSNGAGTDDVIYLTDSVYTLTGAVNDARDRNGLPIIADAVAHGTLTINGSGATIERSSTAPAFRLFYVELGGNLTLNHVTLRGGSLTQGTQFTNKGAGIYNIGTLTLTNVAVTENSITATTSGTNRGYGGGVYNEGTLVIDTSTIHANAVSTSRGSIYNESYGGGIYNSGSLSLIDSTVDSNVTSGVGSGGYSVGAGIYTTGTLYVENSVFAANDTGYGWGGGILTSGPLTVTGSTFNNNISAYGAAIYNNRTTSSIRYSRFDGNTATRTDGAISNQQGEVDIIASTFTGNHSADEGGAIASTGVTSIEGNGILRITQSTFDHNEALYGGAIRISGGVLDLTNSTFFENHARYNGALSVVTDVITSVTNNTFMNNSADNQVGGVGMGRGISAAVHNNLLIDNTAPADGNCQSFVPGGTDNISTDSSCVGFHVIPSAQLKFDPAGLADNGGSTQTIALQASSPAINAGDNASALDADGNPLQYDQRGAGFPRIAGGTVDIGAFESSYAIRAEHHDPATEPDRSTVDRPLPSASWRAAPRR